MSRRRYGIAALSLTLILASCSGSEDPEVAATGQTDPASAELVAGDELAAETSGLSNERFDATTTSPLTEFLGFDVTAGESDLNAKVQDEIVSCMAARGFEYTPTGSSILGLFAGGGRDNDGLVAGSEAWISRYGFGVSTLFFEQDEVGANLVGNTADPLVLGVVDANREYVESLSFADQTAYYEALYGLSTDSLLGAGLEAGLEDGLGDDAMAGLTDGLASGCEPQATQSAMGGVDVLGLFFDISGDLSAMNESVRNDPRVIEAQRELTACLQAEGLPYTDVREARAAIQERVTPLATDASIGGFEEEVDLESALSGSMLDLQDMLNGSGVAYRLTDTHKAELAVIQSDEVELAQTFLGCGVGLMGLAGTELYGNVQAEFEQRFIDENIDRLSAYKS